MQQCVKMEAIIADDDTAAILNTHKNLDPRLNKYSDKNLIKKNNSYSLYNLKMKKKIKNTSHCQQMLLFI